MNYFIAVIVMSVLAPLSSFAETKSAQEWYNKIARHLSPGEHAGKNKRKNCLVKISGDKSGMSVSLTKTKGAVISGVTFTPTENLEGYETFHVLAFGSSESILIIQRNEETQKITVTVKSINGNRVREKSCTVGPL